MRPRLVLSIAGSDSGGGAGIQADIKTVMALGGYAATAITAVTAQNTNGVDGVVLMQADFVRQQIDVVLSDLGADAIKIGMLGNAQIIRAVADILTRATAAPIVLDTVMVAKGGAALLDPDAVSTLRARLMPIAAVITPNVAEAEALTGLAITDLAGARRAAGQLLGQGARAVLIKGGHLPGENATDLLLTAQGETLFSLPRIETRHTHGTGCTLSSAIAIGLAQGHPLADAVRRAKLYVQRAIATAPGLGHGYGPLNHAIPPEEFPA
jgi:hydroxymethylpyrimidine/phosphomethylpyrimidine kinase